MKKSNIIGSLIVLLMLLTGSILSANEMKEQNYKISSASKLWFDGTSTLHDFTCKAEKIYGDVKIVGDLFSSGTDATLKAVNITIPVKNISNEDEDLTENMHESFKAEDYPKITFKLGSADIVNVNESTVKAVAKGKLTISGVTKDVKFEIILKKSGNSIKVNGNYAVKMTDYDIDPPTMFLGTIRTGDEVKIFFELTLNQG